MANYLEGIKIAFSGAGTTLQLTGFAVILGVVLGLLIALLKLAKSKFPRVLGSIYVEILRGTPLLVQALILYAGVPSLLQNGFGINFTWREHEILCGIIVCGINSSAYVAEIIRAGIQAIDKGQVEAARSLGLTNSQTLRFIIIPQAVKVIFPALGNEFVTLIKETAVLSVISIAEITRHGMILSSHTYRYWEAYLGIAFCYLCLTIPLSRIVAYAERRLETSDRS